MIIKQITNEEREVLTKSIDLYKKIIHDKIEKIFPFNVDVSMIDRNEEACLTNQMQTLIRIQEEINKKDEER